MTTALWFLFNIKEDSSALFWKNLLYNCKKRSARSKGQLIRTRSKKNFFPSVRIYCKDISTICLSFFYLLKVLWQARSWKSLVRHSYVFSNDYQLLFNNLLYHFLFFHLITYQFLIKVIYLFLYRKLYLLHHKSNKRKPSNDKTY